MTTDTDTYSILRDLPDLPLRDLVRLDDKLCALAVEAFQAQKTDEGIRLSNLCSAIKHVALASFPVAAKELWQ